MNGLDGWTDKLINGWTSQIKNYDIVYYIVPLVITPDIS